LAFRAHEKLHIYIYIFGVITFFSMNYQKIGDAPTNYHFDQKRASNYHLYCFAPFRQGIPLTWMDMSFFTVKFDLKTKMPLQ